MNNYEKRVEEWAGVWRPAKKEQVWECNECGAQEYTMCVSESDVHELACGSCGADEWHMADARD
jgi:transcription elongation factor Elf1